MDAHLCLRDNLILFNVLQKHQTFKVNLQLPIVISKKILFRHALLYHVHVYKFPAKSVSRSVQTVHTNIIANNRNFHKFATTNSNFEKNDYLDMHHRITYMYINF